MNELAWIQQYLFIVGLDKATSNANFISISHVRAQAPLRLQGKDFASCIQHGSWINPLSKVEELFEDTCSLLLEIPLQNARLPYLMDTFKQHKKNHTDGSLMHTIPSSPLLLNSSL